MSTLVSTSALSQLPPPKVLKDIDEKLKAKEYKAALRAIVVARRGHVDFKKHPLLYEKASRALHELGFYRLAAYYAEKVADALPASSRAQFNVGRNHYLARQLQQANHWFNQCELLEPDYAMNLTGKGFLMLTMQNYAAGWPLYEHRARTEGFVPRKVNNVPLWLGSQAHPVKGKTLFIACEQGLGDTLMFVRYAILLAEQGALITLLVQPGLKAWLSHLIGPYRSKGSELEGRIVNVVTEGEPVKKTDYWCSLPSLPAKMQQWKIPPAPYLKVQAPSVPLPPAKPKTLKVGIAWAGAPGNTRNALRSFPFDFVSSLFDTPHTQFYSLQLNDGLEEAHAHKAWPKIIDLAPQTHSFLDTAQQIAALDLVISIDSAIAHAAGAMGKPCWMLLDAGAEWRNGQAHLSTHPFYATSKLYRANSRSGKQQALDKLKKDLTAHALKYAQSAPTVLPAPTTLKPEVNTTSPSPPAPIASTALPKAAWINILHTPYGIAVYQPMETRMGPLFQQYPQLNHPFNQALLGLVSKQATVFEIGAGFGFSTLPLAHHLKEQGLLVAFEAERWAFQALVTSMTLNGYDRTQIKQTLMGSQKGTVQIGSRNARSNYAFDDLKIIKSTLQIPSTTLNHIEVSQLEAIVITSGDATHILQHGLKLLQQHQAKIFISNLSICDIASLKTSLLALNYVCYRSTLPNGFWLLCPAEKTITDTQIATYALKKE